MKTKVKASRVIMCGVACLRRGKKKCIHDSLSEDCMKLSGVHPTPGQSSDHASPEKLAVGKRLFIAPGPILASG